MWMLYICVGIEIIDCITVYSKASAVERTKHQAVTAILLRPLCATHHPTVALRRGSSEFQGVSEVKANET